MGLLHERYPAFNGLYDPKRHLIFGIGDSAELLSCIFQHMGLFIVLLLFSTPLLTPLLIVSLVFRVGEIRKHASDGWYYPLRRSRHFTQFAPERSAFTTIVEDDRFAPPDRYRTADLTPLQRFFRRFKKESVLAPPVERLKPARPLAPIEQELYGLPRLPLFGARYPTGREMVTTLQRHPLSRKLGFDRPLRRARYSTAPLHALPDFLPWRAKADAGTVRQKDETYTRSWRVSGGAPDSLSALAQLKSRIDNAYIHAPEGATIHALVSVERDERPFAKRVFPVEAAELYAEEHRLRQEATPRIKVEVDIHLVYDPYRDKSNTTEEHSAREASIANYRRFVGMASTFETMLKRAWKDIKVLGRDEDDDEQLHSIAKPLEIGRSHPRRANIKRGANLSELLGRHHVRLDIDDSGTPTGYVRLDDRLVAVYDIYDIETDGVDPDVMRLLESHEAPTIFSLRWIACDHDEERKAVRDAHTHALRSTEQNGGGEGTMVDLHAVEQSVETLNLDRLIKKKQARLGLATATIALYQDIGDGGLQEARQQLRSRTNTLQGAIHHEGYTITSGAPDTSRTRDDTTVVVQAIPGLLGMCIGNVRDNALRNPMPSGVAANLIATYAPWPGVDQVKDPDGLFKKRDGSWVDATFSTVGLDRRRFDFAPQTGRRGGHTFVLADPGGGKSTLIAMLVSSFLGYDIELPFGARVIMLDRDGSHKIHAALHHARFLVCSDAGNLGLGLFLDVESEEGRELVYRTLEAMFRCKKVIVDREVNGVINTIIEHTKTLPPHERTPKNCIWTAPIAQRYKELLERYTGQLFGGTEDPFAGRYTYVDLAPAFASQELRLPTTLALMGAIERTAVSGRGPVFLVAEEFWELLLDEDLTKMFLAWLKRLRKFGVWIFLVTHGFEDLDALEGKAEAFKNAVRNFVFLPSAKFYDEKLVERLKSIGISPSRAKTLAENAPVEGGSVEPVAEIVHDIHHRMVPFDLGPVGRAICGSTSNESRKRFAEILLRHDGQIGPTFVDWIYENGGKYADSWAEAARRLVEDFDALRSEVGDQSPRYDPRLFDEDITDISSAAIAS